MKRDACTEIGQRLAQDSSKKFLVAELQGISSGEIKGDLYEKIYRGAFFG